MSGRAANPDGDIKAWNQKIVRLKGGLVARERALVPSFLVNPDPSIEGNLLGEAFLSLDVNRERETSDRFAE